MDNQATEKRTERPMAARATLGILHFIVYATFSAVDWYHVLALRIKAGERAVPPTKRGTISPGLRSTIRERQGNFCMYCGVALLRLNRNQRHIDHMMPVERGGPNEESNMQALCGRCNSRKGVQSDGEFRERYGELMKGLSPGQPPPQRIEQKRFVSVSKKTRQLASTREARMAVFKTPAQKISSASAAAGVAAGVAWFFAAGLTLPEEPWAGNIILGGAIAAFGLTWAASMGRARFTGLLDKEYVDKASLKENRDRGRH